MSAPELLALSLVLSVVAAVIGLTAMRALERRAADPALRERAWAGALYAPALPPLVVGLMLMTPAPERTAPADPAASIPASVLVELQGAAGLPPVDLFHTASILVLTLAGLFAGLRIISLAVRLMRLRGLIRATATPSPELRRTVEGAAARIGATMPAIRVDGTGAEALLAGLRKPVLILPAALAAEPDSAPTRAVCAHELAHLRRGDHRALWIEEALLAALAINPLLRIIRDHRAAAREEACDAAALAGAGDDERRLYARSLLDAIRATGFRRTAPALSFTSARRTFVMNRLKAVLAPAGPAGPRSRRIAVGLAAVLAGFAGAGSLAVAAQRQPVVVPAPVDVVADQPDPAPAPAPRPRAAAVPAPSERPAPVAAPAPRPRPVVAEAPVAPLQVSPPAEISRVTWAQHPMPMYPGLAAANGIDSGTVVLTCTVEGDGRASGCTVLSETPEGAGFGEAALASMERARFSPRTVDGAAPDAKARFTIRFRLAE